MEISDERKEKIWRDLLENQRYETDLLPHERTKKMLMKEYNLSINQVESFINKLLSRGFITKRRTVVNGKTCVVYTLIEK
jgi:predicted transcriptional regulator